MSGPQGDAARVVERSGREQVDLPDLSGDEHEIFPGGARFEPLPVAESPGAVEPRRKFDLRHLQKVMRGGGGDRFSGGIAETRDTRPG
jgi:hypothetical protein